MAYGLIGQIETVPGKRDELIAILTHTGAMPGCVHYIVGKDAENQNIIWVTEIWKSAEAHRASLEFPAVQSATKQGRPLIAEFKMQKEIEAVGDLDGGTD